MTERPRLTLSALAREDLHEIWLYIGRDNREAADRTFDLLYESAERLVAFPHLGRPQPDLPEGVHAFPIDNFVLFYHPSDGGIDVLRIARAAQGRLSFEWPADEIRQAAEKADAGGPFVSHDEAMDDLEAVAQGEDPPFPVARSHEELEERLLEGLQSGDAEPIDPNKLHEDSEQEGKNPPAGDQPTG